MGILHNSDELLKCMVSGEGLSRMISTIQEHETVACIIMKRQSHLKKGLEKLFYH